MADRDAGMGRKGEGRKEGQRANRSRMKCCEGGKGRNDERKYSLKINKRSDQQIWQNNIRKIELKRK